MVVIFILADVSGWSLPAQSQSPSQSCLRGGQEDLASAQTLTSWPPRKHSILQYSHQILEQPTSTPRISKAVDSVLELCSEATAMRMSVMLIWPLLIAGLFCVPETRPKVVSLFDAFQGDYCEDLVVAVSRV
jgi:hypothetical protein